MPKTIAGAVVVREIVAREGTVYLTAKYAYKVFGANVNLDQKIALYERAEREGVSVPDSSKFSVSLVDGASTTVIRGIRTILCGGRFFQLSKPGGEATLTREINQITDKKILKRVISGLENAAALGVTDPQGFIDPHRTPAIYFIDLHYTGNPNNVTFAELLGQARARMVHLESVPEEV